jgi:ubiquinone/menaquinone biosynthesis C-methylase UbiE
MVKKVNHNFWESRGIKQYFNIYNELRTSVAHPFILENINKSKKIDILDYGCGEGDLSIQISQFPNTNVLGLDISKPVIHTASNKYKEVGNLKFQTVEDFETTKQKKFNLIILSLVLVTIKEKSEAIKILKYLKKLLKPNGILYLVDTHPCFRNETFTSSETTFNQQLYKNNYQSFLVTLNDFYNSKNSVTFEDCHKTLEEICSILFEGGFLISKIKELYDKVNKNTMDEFSIKNFNEDVPIFLYIEAK